jgi:hypothetical protein
MQKNADNSSFLLLLPLSPRNETSPKNKKPKAHEICNNNYILIHEQNTISKNEKKKKKNPRICQGRQISPSCDRPYFVPDFSCVRVGLRTQETRKRAGTHTRAKGQKRDHRSRGVLQR